MNAINCEIWIFWSFGLKKSGISSFHFFMYLLGSSGWKMIRGFFTKVFLSYLLHAKIVAIFHRIVYISLSEMISWWFFTSLVREILLKILRIRLSGMKFCFFVGTWFLKWHNSQAPASSHIPRMSERRFNGIFAFRNT